MATRSTVFKAQLQVADIDHGYYAEHALTLARHPSETDERMMVRLVALALNAWQLQAVCAGDGSLRFGAGLSDPDEPDVMLIDFTGRCRLWVEVGQPEERPINKACQRADAVTVYCYGSAADLWWNSARTRLERMERLSVWRIPSQVAQMLAPLAQRSMQLQATIQDGLLMLSGEDHSVEVECERLK